MSAGHSHGDPPQAWVWSQYRGVATSSDATPPAAPVWVASAAPIARSAAAAAPAPPGESPTFPKRPPLVPQKSGSGAGMLAGLLILTVIGGVWWMSQTAPRPATSAETDAPPTDGSVADAPAAENAAERTAVAPSDTAASGPAKTESAHAPAAENKPPPPAATAAEKIAAAKEKLAALPSSGALDAAACETALNATVTVEKIQFRSGSASIQPASNQLLDRLASLLKRCMDAKAEINGYTDNVGSSGNNEKLSLRRANAIRDYLKSAGVGGDRLTAMGHGPSDPIASNDTEQGRAENRRIGFTVR